MTYSIRFQRPVILVLLALTALSLGVANTNSRQHGQPAKSIFHKIYDEDQKNRNDSEGDARRRAQVRQLIADDKLQSGEDYYYAAFIFQHGQKPEDYLYAHVLATTALGKGFAPAKWLSAATLDRYLRSIEQPQIFGTQFGRGPADDDMSPYDKDMLSDRIRKTWCVTSYSEQMRIIENSKAGKEFTSTRICPIPD